MHLRPARQSSCFIPNSLIRLLYSPGRSGLQRLPLENRALRERRARAGAVALRANAEKNLILREEEEEDSDEEEEEEYTEEEVETYDQSVSVLKRGPSSVGLSDDGGKRQCMRPLTSLYHQPQTVMCPLHEL